MQKQIFLTLAAVAAVACSDGGSTSPREAQPAVSDVPAQGALIEIAGIVEITGTDLNPVYLRAGEERYRLDGPEALTISRLAGAEVRVRGSFDAAPGLWVQSFRVLVVNGRTVLDGVIEMIDGGVAIRLADGAMFPLGEFPAELLRHVGARVWFAAATDGTPAAFGIIVE